MEERRARGDGAFDFDRLEVAIEGLLASYEKLRTEAEHMRRQLEERDTRIRQLDERLLDQNQRRLVLPDGSEQSFGGSYRPQHDARLREESRQALGKAVRAVQEDKSFPFRTHDVQP